MRPLLLCLALIAAVPSAEGQPRRNPETVSSGVVRDIVDGDTLVLEGGTEVRLVGIQAPKLPLGRRNFKPWPLAGDSKAALAALTLGHTLRLSYGTTPIDRHGRLLAHLHDQDGNWVQGALLARGMARVYTFRDNRGRAAEMLAIEAKARRAVRGIWGHPYYRVITDKQAGRHIDTFQLVEGRIVDAAVVRRRAYLNFGRDWRTDFTISIRPRDVRLFRKAGRPPQSFRGLRVRVRGWLKSYNGPMITVTHPEQIEMLGEAGNR